MSLTSAKHQGHKRYKAYSKNIILITMLIIGMLLQAAPLKADPAAVTQPYDRQASRLIVELSGDADLRTLAEASGGKLIRTGPLNYCTLQFSQIASSNDKAEDNATQPQTIREKVLNHPGVLSAQWSKTYKVDTASTAAITDSESELQWGLKQIRASEVWDEGVTGQGIIIAVIDTGVDHQHPDFKDKSGKISNLVQGYNAFTRSTGQEAAQDDHGHGTSVAGVIAARHNDIGIIGVAYNAKIMPIKAMDKTGEGEDSIIADGIIWAADHGAKIINMSIGSQEQAKVLDDAIDYAVKKGCLLIGASGNIKGFQTETISIPQSKTLAGVAYPGAHPEVIAVSAVDRYDRLTDFALTGPEVALSAPGHRILTAYWSPKETGCAYASGTSIAAPFVTGAAALLWSQYPELKAADIKAALYQSAIDLGEEGQDEGYGYGRLDIFRALKLLQGQKKLSSPARLGWEGGQVYLEGSAEELSPYLNIPAGTFPLTVDAIGRDNKITVAVKKTDTPGKFSEEIIPVSESLALSWGEELANKAMTLSLKLDITPELDQANTANIISLYKWSNTRWIRVGGGFPSTNQTIEVPIYEPGIYRAGQTQQQDISRLSGIDRIQTALEIARNAFPTGADTVVIARADDFPDALAGAPLAYKLHAPIILTPSVQLPLEVNQAIRDLKPQKIVILGGENAISQAIERQLSSIAYVLRIAGENRYSTSAAIAERLSTRGEAMIVNGLNFPDAIAAASNAALEGIPILLTPSDSIAPETLKTLRRKLVTKTQVIGGKAVITESLYKSLPYPLRISGQDRFATSAEIIRTNPPKGKQLYIATGLNYPDALTGGVLAAVNNSHILLLPRSGPTLKQTELLQTLGEKSVITLGGEGAVSEEVRAKVQEILKH